MPAVVPPLVADPDRAKAKRVSDVIIGMLKFDISALEAAHAGNRPPAG